MLSHSCLEPNTVRSFILAPCLFLKLCHILKFVQKRPWVCHILSEKPMGWQVMLPVSPRVQRPGGPGDGKLSGLWPESSTPIEANRGESRSPSGRLTVWLRNEVRGLDRNHLCGQARGRRLGGSRARLLESQIDLFIRQPWGRRAQNGPVSTFCHCPRLLQNPHREKTLGATERLAPWNAASPISDSLEPL